MSQSCLGCIVEVFCVVRNAGNANTELKMSILPLCRVGNVYVHRVNRVVFSVFGGLGGDFCKDIYEAKGCILEVF